MTSHADFLNIAAATNAQIRTLRSAPLNRGIIRADYFQAGRFFYIFDHSDNSAGFHRVLGLNNLKKVLFSIEAAA